VTQETVEEHEEGEIQARARLKAPMIYEIVRREGDDEMNRPAASLWWSGVAAGLSISFSLLTLALLKHSLPTTPWAHLLDSFGYSVGFLIVVLGRQQLFTENTITVVLPVIAHPSMRNALLLARLWSIVLCANLVGAVLAAVFCAFSPCLEQPILNTMVEVSAAALAHDAPHLLFGGVSSGFLIAAMVWLLPSAQGAQFTVVVVLTSLIALGDFPHGIAGAVEAALAVFSGRASVFDALFRFEIPVLIGNIVGGTALFALISYAQVAKEVEDTAA
jgi:formate/nitrite transporter FocA (FNT family)